ncbi:TVP38/TMEM64 family protein [Jeotgalibacillus proteolyticus]|uniref:TVP38/TMEM64 family membrane protein n=1 Tax=Jeotgalibacillus proteolyticus TaxID=2082395 RepID=A0A2S5G8R9_9BACL|nr:VTT domain-containing protein [Jeotgalibacillus proteolyticus]PPA69314.1 TVP38/TMEM64 family protein [Jeotgalibacillus proteolyticus]
MEQFDQSIELFIESAGWLAPVLFILLHLLRPFLFLPVIVVCIAGGVLFGFLEGALLSFFGLSLMSLVSYQLVNKFPRFRAKLSRLKDKVFRDRTLSVSQVMVLRIMPFVHFHLLSLYLMEMSKTFKEYMYYSMLGVIMPAVLYTAFGELIRELPWYMTLIMLALLIGVFQLLGRLNKSHVQPN